eukprot:Hpha_TRINITY_DN1918_c0_g1::TRINITY_DN1918_c0_g1_i1::g.30918::m.30918
MPAAGRLPPLTASGPGGRASLAVILSRRDSPSGIKGLRVVPKGGGDKTIGLAADAWILRKGEAAEVVETRGDTVKLRSPDGRVSPWLFAKEYEEEDMKASALEATHRAIEAVERWLATTGTGAGPVKSQLQKLQGSLLEAVEPCTPEKSITADGGTEIVAGGQGGKQRTASTAAADFGELGEGAYLTFEAQGHGTLSLTWAKQRVDGALFYAAPQKPVPAFKFKGSGKQELVRGCQRDKKVYLRGFAEFVKAAVAFDCLVQYADFASSAPIPTALVFRRPDGVIERLQERGPPLAVSGFDVVAAVPFSNAEIGGGSKIMTLVKPMFIQMGNDHGSTVTLS